MEGEAGVGWGTSATHGCLSAVCIQCPTSALGRSEIGRVSEAPLKKKHTEREKNQKAIWCLFFETKKGEEGEGCVGRLPKAAAAAAVPWWGALPVEAVEKRVGGEEEEAAWRRGGSSGPSNERCTCGCGGVRRRLGV